MFGNIDNYEYLGLFENTSNKFFVSDPCYNKKTWCAGSVKAKKGIYHCFAMYVQTDWHTRIASLLVIHDININDFNFNKKNKEKFSVGVDSGQAGIWDYDSFGKKLSDYDYSQVGYVTLGGSWRLEDDEEDDAMVFEDEAGRKDSYHELHPLAGVLQYGAVSQTGFGDGSYTCYTSSNKPGSWVMIKSLDHEDIQKVITWKDYVAAISEKRIARKKEEDERFKSFIKFQDMMKQIKEKQV
jgi:hypothetical protein